MARTMEIDQPTRRPWTERREQVHSAVRETGEGASGGGGYVITFKLQKDDVAVGGMEWNGARLEEQRVIRKGFRMTKEERLVIETQRELGWKAAIWLIEGGKRP